MTRQIIGNGNVITHNEENPYIPGGAVVIEENRIIDCGSDGEMKKNYPDATYTDAKGQLIMPGFINAHGHIYSAFARGMILKDGKVSKNFTQVLENLWWRVDKSLTLDDIKYSAYATYIDSIKNGGTTFIDHHASPNSVEGSLFTIAEAAKVLGIRTSLCYEVSDRDGEAIASAGIKENVDFMKHAEAGDSDMIHGLFGLHASFTVSQKTLDRCVEAKEGLKGGFHVHVAEGIDDLYDSLEKYGKRVVERLNDKGILGDRSIAVHCIHVNDAELEILKRNNTIVVHNPESNMGNAVGCSALLRMMGKGILVGLGTDGFTTDMTESLKVTNVLHKHHLCDPGAGWGEPPQALFANNSAIAARYFKKPVGIIAKDASADIIIVDYNPLTPLNENNIASHILFGVMGRCVTSTMINGRFVMRDREILPVDEKAIFAESRKQAEDFWKRV